MSFGTFRSRVPRDILATLENTKEEAKQYAQEQVNQFSSSIMTEVLPNLTVSGGISPTEFAAFSASFSQNLVAVEVGTMAYADQQVTNFSASVNGNFSDGISATEFEAFSASFAQNLTAVGAASMAYADQQVQAATGSMIVSGAVDTTSLTTLSGSMAAAVAAMELQMNTNIGNIDTGASSAEVTALSGTVGTEINQLVDAIATLESISSQLQSRVSYNTAIIGMPEHIILTNDTGTEYSLHVNDDGDLLFDAYANTGSACNTQLVALEYLTLKAPNGQHYQLSVQPDGGLTFDISTLPTGSC